MSCSHCSTCSTQAFLDAEKLAVDAYARGNYDIARIIRNVMEQCQCAQKNLSANDKAYIRNVAGVIDNPKWSVKDKAELTRDIRRLIRPSTNAKARTHARGFRNMLDTALGTDEPIPASPEPIARDRGFAGMIEAAFPDAEQPHQTVITRQVQPYDFESHLPLICSDECIAKRHCPSFPANDGFPCTRRPEQYSNEKMKAK